MPGPDPTSRQQPGPANAVLEITGEVVVAGGGGRRHRSRAGAADALLEVTGEVVVAGGGGRRHRSRAGAAALDDGSLFVAWRVGRDMFQEPHGALVATRSADGGETWEEPAPLLAEPGWDWFGAQRLLHLDDGTLLMVAGKARWNTDRFHTYAIRSTDGGRTWDPPGPEIRVFAAFSEPYGQGVVRGLPDGRLLLGFQGTDTPGAPNLAAVAFSRDRGDTWSERVLLSDDPELEPREPDTLPLPDGRLLTVLRTDAPPFASYQCYSEDGGRSWTPLTATGFHGHCPRLFALRRAVLCVYRDMAEDRPGIGCSASWDGGASWHFQRMLHRSPGPYQGWGAACGYPGVVRLADGQLLCVFHTDFVDGDCEIRAVRLREVE